MTRKITLLLIATIFSGTAFSQISFEDKEFVYTGLNYNILSTEVKTYVHNNATDPADTTITWQAANVVKESGWELTICTGDLCVSDPFGDYSFDMPTGEKMEVKLGFSNFNTPGNGEVYLIAKSALNPTMKDTVYFQMKTWGVEVDLIEKPEFSIYPNPATDVITINFSLDKIVTVKIYDILGNTMITKNVRSGDRIDISELAKGVYVVRTESNSQFSKVFHKQ
ncbi:T9SS type A sorting domain-containing protein [Bacteroidia bacterium]|nr:T9SS type A sorting domain-containing protein [Bacteroidia bacterium]